jgi:methylase of polypeptide subunit release factors
LLSNQIIIYDLKMKTYQQLWQSITTLYEAGEAQAIVRTVLDVKYGMTLTDIICGKVNELSADEERKLEEIIRRLQKGEPVQYVLGKADFAGRTFHVSGDGIFGQFPLLHLVDHLLRAMFGLGAEGGELQERLLLGHRLFIL